MMVWSKPWKARGIRLIPVRQLAASAIAASLIAFCSAAESHAQDATRTCADPDIAILPSPIVPWTGAPLRVMFVADKPLQGELSLIAPDGRVAAKSRHRLGGPPYSWFVEVQSPAAGTWHATLTREGAPTECQTITRDIAVHAGKPPPPHATPGSVWPLRNAWNRAMENLYSAWIEKLFDAPLDVELSWPALHVGLRDRARNFLFNYVGLGEDEMKLVYRPDCADLPYFLRAYFAFKMGLPFGFSKCSRGGSGKPPHCVAWSSMQSAQAGPSASADEPESNGAVPQRLGLVSSFGNYLRIVADGVHSGTARTALNDNNTDLYPVPLTQETLRPGTVYADPYGHTLVLVRRVPQTGGGAGVFLAVDAQPDGTVARKRFWRGNFLFAHDPALGGAGFKRFRPIVSGKSGLRRLTNDEIAKNPQYADFSLDQAKLGIEGFYDRMDDVMSPQPLDPERALMEAITSLEEQVKVRVTSVENGRKFQNGGHSEATMPEGAAIFETVGPWEDFSTPARDLRLLIALDVVRGFPDRVARRPERYAMPQGESAAEVKAELQKVLASELSSRKFSYTRSDGSAWTLTLKDVFARMTDLEMAYNPNDCVELRWGAPPNSEEASTCRRHAPTAQRAKMTKYRAWFHERRRPPRA
jgi:hypothetical protein